MADQSRPVTGDPAPYAADHRKYATIWRSYVSGPPNTYASQQRATDDRNFNILAWSICIGVCSLIIWQIWLALIAYPLFYLETLTVSNFSISSFAQVYQFSGVWDAQFIVRNPNSKISIYCDQIQVAVLSDLCSISETAMPPFVQGTKNETAIRARFTFSSAYVFDKDDLIAPQRSKGAIKFNVWMMVRVKPSARGAHTRKLRVFCPDLQIVISSKGDAGTMVGGLKKCMVHSDFAQLKIRPPKVHTCALGLY